MGALADFRQALAMLPPQSASREAIEVELRAPVTDLERAFARAPHLARDPGLIGRLTGLLPTLPPGLADRGRALLSPPR